MRRADNDTMSGVREPALAGSFYAATAAALRRQVEACLTPAIDPGTQGPIIAAVCPHAGLAFSGRTAGAVYPRLATADSLVILGPNHYGVGAAAALSRHARWQTPLGAVAIDRDLAEAIRAGAPSLAVDDAAHAREHAIEVQLPFVRHLMPEAGLVPISIGHIAVETVEEIGRAVAEGVRTTGRRAVVVASTDFSHHVPRLVAERKDRHALEAIRALDAEGLLAAVQRERITM